MEVNIYVIKDCMYCDTLLKGLPKVVKKFPNVAFKVTCVTESKEFELFGEFGPNKKFYYLLSHPSPIDELKKFYLMVIV